MTVVVATSTEFLWVPVRSDHPITGATDLSVYPVDIAILASSSDPVAGDWKSATWESSTKIINGLAYYLARVQIGPGSSITLTAGSTYITYARVTVGGVTAVVRAGMLQVV